jgi:hypothetical protein
MNFFTKESLMKLDKEALVDIILHLTKEIDRMAKKIGSVISTTKFSYPGIEKIDEEISSITKDIKDIKSSSNSKEDFEAKVKKYFDELK